MAAHAASGTLTASTVATVSLTGWAPYISINIDASPAGTASVTVDGTTPTVQGADTTSVDSGTKVILKNLSPGNVLGGAAATTTVKLISAAALGYDVELVSDKGDAVVLA